MSDHPTLSIILLGAGQEVGRSCCVLQYRGKTVVCDAGVHLGYEGLGSLPYIDELDWSTVDVILITHFHLDHAASLTYILEKTNFKDGKGKVYMTHPTKAVYKFLMQDFVRMNGSNAEPLFSALDLSVSLASITPVAAHQHITVSPGLSFIPYHAGHVLGACDYSREEDRHLVSAEVPPIHPDVLIVESTFGVQGYEEREEKELRFTSLVHAIIRRGGHVLMPVFALGRAQELLLLLEEYWKKHPDLHSVPIYYASNLARKCMAVYQTYIHMMNDNIRSRFEKRDNPFKFQHIINPPQGRGWEKKIAEGPPCVILATPGFLQYGSSRELLEAWAPDSRNGLVITGYSIEGTLARDIINEPDEIQSYRDGRSIPRRLSVDYISFSAHVDGPQNMAFIDLVKAQHIVLVHGEEKAMLRLRSKLTQNYKDKGEDAKIHAPKNLEELNLTFRGERVAKAIGTLATNAPKANGILSGLLVSKDYSYTLLDPRDLRDFTGLSTCVITQRQRIALQVGFELVRWHLEGMYGKVEDGVDADGNPTLRVMGAIDVKHTGEHELMFEWESSSSNDMIADACLSLIMGIDKSPASVKLTTHSHHHHHHPHADPEKENLMVRIQRLAMFLEAHFGDVELHLPEDSNAEEDEDDPNNVPALIIHLDESEAFINLETMTVESQNDVLRKRVESVLDIAVTTISSLNEMYTSVAPTVAESPEKEMPSSRIEITIDDTSERIQEVENGKGAAIVTEVEEKATDNEQVDTVEEIANKDDEQVDKDETEVDKDEMKIVSDGVAVDSDDKPSSTQNDGDQSEATDDEVDLEVHV